MKKIYIMAFAAFSIISLSGCSDFLDREPLTQPEATTFLSGKTQVENYINGLYINLPSFDKWGMGSRGEDKNSDNIIADQYDKRLNGEYNQFSGTSDWQTGYQNLRKVNYFFYYYNVAENQEDDDLRSLKGEAYFLRAYWHFYLLKKFGSIPVMDAFWDGNATVEGLQIPAKTRTEVAKFILEDLNTAASLLYSRSKYAGIRINKEAAMTLAMNVALFEGSWEKYHAGTDFAAVDADGNKIDESVYFFGEVIKWGDELFKSGITLYTGGNDVNDPGNSYAQLFNSKDLSGIDEVLLWRKYSDADGVFHSINGNLKAGVVDTEGPAGVSQSLVDNYLNLDGTFIDPVSQAEQLKDFNKMFENRDPRLLQTIMHNGCKWASASNIKPMNILEYSEADKDNISAPKLAGEGNTRSLTGYHIRLGVDTTFVNGNGETACPIIRYSEALLAYAEAAEELNACSPDIFNKTIGELRRRAGITRDNAPIQYSNLSEIKTDANFSQFGYTISPVLQEIRRERRSELALQGYRLDDLMRWRADKLIVNQRGRGAYIGYNEANTSTLFKAYSPSDQKIIRERLILDENGWADPMAGTLASGYQFHANRDYLLAIPPSELNLNKTLKQNPNW